MIYQFKPEIETVSKFRGCFNISELAKETSVYAASPKFVRKNCGPIANMILDKVPKSYMDRCEALGMIPNIDIRIHRLNIGEFPAVPGWHCDGALRETYFAQPDPNRIAVRDTVIGTVSSHKEGITNTQFLMDKVNIEVDQSLEGFSLWRNVHERLKPKKVKSSIDGILYQIGCNTLHRAMPAIYRGWRLFFRMSMWHNDYLGDEGQIATQQQVYLVHEGNGW